MLHTTFNILKSFHCLQDERMMSQLRTMWASMIWFACFCLQKYFCFSMQRNTVFSQMFSKFIYFIEQILGTFVHLWMYSSWCQIWSSNYFTIFYFWQICNVLVMSFAHACYIMHYWKVIWDSTHWIRIFSKKDTDIMIYVCYIHTFYTIRYQNQHYGPIIH